MLAVVAVVHQPITMVVLEVVEVAAAAMAHLLITVDQLDLLTLAVVVADLLEVALLVEQVALVL
jgi:predicted nucleic acid-binding protein